MTATGRECCGELDRLLLGENMDCMGAWMPSLVLKGMIGIIGEGERLMPPLIGMAVSLGNMLAIDARGELLPAPSFSSELVSMGLRSGEAAL
jgi:hypothetical protein